MSAATAAAGHAFGKYTLVAKLAIGGMAEIFLARLVGAAGFEKLVVIKRILPHLAKDQQLVQMFLAEARIAAQISHPNVCQVFELGEIDGRYFIAMEYLEGVPFSCFRRRDLYPAHPDPRLIAGLGVQACEGLHHAHQLKRPDGTPLEVVHRDVSSNNLFATVDGVVKVLDFGIAKVQDASVRTTTGSVKGTYAYMAPEQLRGEPVDRRTDVFAAGIVLWELFARRHLFKRDTDFLTFQAITTDPIPEVAELRPDVPPELSRAIARALSRDREERFPTARAFGEALAQAVQPIGGPWSAAAIADELGRAFEARMRDQQALIRLAREGGALELDDDLGPAIGHGTAMMTTPVSFARAHPDVGGVGDADGAGDAVAARAARAAVAASAAAVTVPGSAAGVRAAGGAASMSATSMPAASMPAASMPAVAALPMAAAMVAPGLPEAPRRSGLPMALLALLALGGVGAAGYFYAQSRAKGAPPPAPATPIAMAVTTIDAAAVPAPPAAAPVAPAAPATPPEPGPSPTFDKPAGSGSQARSPATRPDTRPPADARPSAASAKKEPVKDPPRSGPPGFITIDSSPMYSVIYIDGKSYGETPLVRLSLPPGRHSLRAVSPSGASRAMTITIESGKVAPTRRIEW